MDPQCNAILVIFLLLFLVVVSIITNVDDTSDTGASTSQSIVSKKLIAIQQNMNKVGVDAIQQMHGEVDKAKEKFNDITRDALRRQFNNNKNKIEKQMKNR